jgi:hypothetical protein
MDLQAAATDHRAVPLEVLREFARSQAELTSIRLVAEDAGVGRSTLHKFITAGTMPHPRVRRLLALWYLRRMGGVDETELVRPYVSALEVLVGEVPEQTRMRVTMHVLDSVDQGYTDAGEETPRWINALRTRLARTAGPATLVWR